MLVSRKILLLVLWLLIGFVHSFGQNVFALDYELVDKKIANGEIPEAKQILNALLFKSFESQDSSTAGIVLLKLAEINLHHEEIMETIGLYDRCAQVSEFHNDTIWADALIAQATIYEIMGDKLKAIEILQPVISRSHLRADEKASALVVLADGLIDLGYVDSAKVFLDQALDLTATWPDSQAITACYQNYGNLYFRKHDYQSSLAHFLKALSFYPTSLDSSGISNIYNNISQLYFFLEQPEQTLEYANKGSQTSKKYGNTFAYNCSQNLKGRAAVGLGDVDTGIALLNESLAYFVQRGRANYRYRVLLDLAGAHLKKNELELSEGFLIEADKIKNVQQGHRFEIGSHLIWFDLLFKKNEMSTAGDHLRKAEKLSRKVLDKGALKSVLERCVIYYENFGDYRNGFESMKELKGIENELLSLSKIQLVNEIQNKYDKAENEKQILKLTLENGIKSATIERQRFRLLTGLIALFLVGTFLFIVFRQNRKIKQQNQVISEALEERETLLREIHHRVKNNLQVISSLLYLQSETIKDEKALEALQEGRNRVKSMSLIHQNLYQGNDLIGVNTKVYFDKLIRSLFSSYNIDHELIDIQCEIESLNLSVDTLVPIALIVNELMSNSLKHAFEPNKKGNIEFQFKEEQGKLVLKQSDNGNGITGDWRNLREKSFGFQLIDILGKKLKAEIEISGDSGFSFLLTCPSNHND